MNRNKLLNIFIILIFISSQQVFSHSGKAKHHIIIDTDGGTDDFRAICLALASQDFEVLAITTSDGVLNPEMTALNVKALLRELGHSGIPVGKGVVNLKKPPVFRKYAEKISWGCTANVSIINQSANEILFKTLSNENDHVTLVCLGGLTNMASLMQLHPEVKNKIDCIIWYNESLKKPEGFNFTCDRESANKVINSGIKVKMISGQDFTNWSWKSFKSFGIPYLLYDKMIEAELLQFADNEHMKNSPLLPSDELCIFYLTDTMMFSGIISQNNSIKPNNDADFSALVYKLLTDKASPRNQVFDIFPSETKDYQADIQKIKDETISKFGMEEWRSIVLTSELHGHLGIYAVIGAKMGLLAREYFNIGKDEFKIASYTGTIPPFSCMNDGLQVSTGSTTGHGLLTISEQKTTQPSADFTFKNTSIRIALKPEYSTIIANDIKLAIAQFGLENDLYWIKVRELALKYWSEWNRTEIFNIEVIK